MVRAVVGLFMVAGCKLITEPDVDRVAGGYQLELIDARPLPVRIESGACPREVHRGELGLAPEINNRKPLYTVYALLRFSCDTTRIPPPGESELVTDFGQWRLRGDNVEFQSSQGRSTYVVPLTPAVDGGEVSLNLMLDGYQLRFRRVRPYGHPGIVSLTQLAPTTAIFLRASHQMRNR